MNLGLRWEYFGVQHNVNPNLDSNFYTATNAPNQFVAIAEWRGRDRSQQPDRRVVEAELE